MQVCPCELLFDVEPGLHGFDQKVSAQYDKLCPSAWHREKRSSFTHVRLFGSGAHQGGVTADHDIREERLTGAIVMGKYQMSVGIAGTLHLRPARGQGPVIALRLCDWSRCHQKQRPVVLRNHSYLKDDSTAWLTNEASHPSLVQNFQREDKVAHSSKQTAPET